MDKYQDFAGEPKKLWNMKVTVIPIIVDALETVPNNFKKRLCELEIKGRIETTQITALLKSARLLNKALDIWRNLPPLRRPWNTSSYKLCEKLTRNKLLLLLLLFYYLRVFYTSFNWWSFTGDWETASLFWTPGIQDPSKYFSRS